MKYIETRTMSAYELRRLCIKNNWYTHGTNEEYMQLFAKLRDENHMAVEMTTEKLVELAEDIYRHSDANDCIDGFLEIPFILYDLVKICDTTFREA